jgi:hypothetical protein
LPCAVVAICGASTVNSLMAASPDHWTSAEAK